ncbi:MAG: TRAP transporter substrate-binding protein [Syntrophobacteraceae bacterium]
MSKVLFYLAAVLFGVLWCSTGAMALTLRTADIHREGYPTVEAVKYMGKLLSDRSGGRLSVEVFHSGQLGEEKESLEQCRAGGLDMLRTNLAPLVDEVPEAGVIALPYIFRSEEHLHRVLDGPIGREILDSLEESGLVGLAFYDSGIRSFYTSQKPLRTIEDFKGMRIRVQQTELFKAMVEVLGGIPVPMPYGEVQDALRMGVIDGAENNLPSYHVSGHYTVAKYYSNDGHSMPPEVLVFSKKVWDGLSEEDRLLILQSARDSVPYMREKWRAHEDEAQRVLTRAGVQIIDSIDREPFIEAVRPLYDRYSSTPKLLDMVRRIQETQ